MRATPHGVVLFSFLDIALFTGGVSSWHDKTPRQTTPLPSRSAQSRQQATTGTSGRAVPSSQSTPRPSSLVARPSTGCASLAPTQSCVDGNEPRERRRQVAGHTHYDTGRISTTRYCPVSENTLYIYGAGAPSVILSIDFQFTFL
jgi:hypothetical protein